MNAAVTLQIGGETLLLHPDRAVLWPRERAVIVADTHFGKSGVFGRHGLAVPYGSDELDRVRLSNLAAKFEIKRLIVLGDFLHAPMESECQDALDMESWKNSLPGIKIQVIAGNHDRGITSGWRGSIEWIAGEHVEPPFRFVHDCAARSTSSRVALFSMSGHVHPVIRLKGLKKRAARVPVFWLRKNALILPSFGLFTGGFAIDPAPGEQVFAVSPERVVSFPVRTPPGH